MGNFFRCYLTEIYRAFDGDLALLIVLGEIAHHHISRCYTGRGEDRLSINQKIKNPGLRQQLHPCSPFSLSTATGIPRETVRRKINQLVTKDWLCRNPKGEVFMTEAKVKHFNRSFDRHQFREFMATAERIGPLLHGSKLTRKHPSL